MDTSLRLLCGLLLMLSLTACDSMELTIAVAPGPDGSLLVRNANDAEWRDVRLVVEAEESDKSTTICTEETTASWRPGEEIRVPVCGAKMRLTLSVGNDIARFSYANGQLFRRIGRKEVPIQ